jgi:sulfite reductase beta subunit-like hemoprotein
MDAKEFLDEMLDEWFPREVGPEISLECHDPQFLKKELKEMARSGLIILDKKNWTYRLTMKATKMKDGGCK